MLNLTLDLLPPRKLIPIMMCVYSSVTFSIAFISSPHFVQHCNVWNDFFKPLFFCGSWSHAMSLLWAIIWPLVCVSDETSFGRSREYLREPFYTDPTPTLLSLHSPISASVCWGEILLSFCYHLGFYTLVRWYHFLLLLWTGNNLIKTLLFLKT